MMGSYGEEKTVVRRRIEQVAKVVPKRFIRMVICMSRTIPKYHTREILKLKPFGDQLCVSELDAALGIKFRSGAVVKEMECEVPLDIFSLVTV